ncbi:MAG TPA: Lrp/AsnC family transcriptional regulator [Micrococcaceae bacterium]|jgi:DNA-binding Lrp family transcriptional regulator|nr:Lrp/AsnC family transcriptional regulator [Micrococcaceae bacterium]
MAVDVLDAKIVRLFNDVPRISVLEASRVLQVARATVQSRLERMIESGVIGSWVPQPDPARFGFPVVAFCSFTISQNLGHDAVVESLSAIPEILEIHTVSGGSDLMARIAARTNSDLQRVLDAVIATGTIQRSSSVLVLNTHFEGRTLPLLEAAAAAGQ